MQFYLDEQTQMIVNKNQKNKLKSKHDLFNNALLNQIKQDIMKEYKIHPTSEKSFRR